MNLFSMVFTGLAVMQNPGAAHAQAVQPASAEIVGGQNAGVSAQPNSKPAAQVAPATTTPQDTQSTGDGGNDPATAVKPEQGMQPWSGY